MNELPIASPDLPSDLKQIIEYRKSGLSINHVVGCPLDCGYCVRHLFSNYEMKKPHLVVSDKEAVEQLVNYWAFRRDLTPIQIFNRATDPFLPKVKDHLFATLRDIDQRGLKNLVLVITRWKISASDVAYLESLRNIRLTILVTWSGIDDPRIEPIDSGIAENSLRVMSENASRTKTLLYWRPLILGINDTKQHIERARQLAKYADATVFTGLFYRDQIRSHFRDMGLPDLYEEIARRKILPEVVERDVLNLFSDAPLFRKTSCGVAYAHGISDYNGHYGIPEICEICPAKQQDLCRNAHQTPTLEKAKELAVAANLDLASVSVGNDKIEVSDSTEQQRYFVQHALNYQVHDRAHPHKQYRHGRAEVGWS